jgi:hypothetical protein
MTRRRAVRALDRIVRCQSLEELLACPASDRADIYQALREMRRPSPLWRGAVVVTAFRRRVTPAYVEDRAATLLATASEIRRHDLYALLGVDPGVTLYDLRHRWRTLAKALHPDRGSRAGGTLFSQLRAAYGILSDPLQRARYDDAWRRAHGPLVSQIEKRPPGLVEDPGWRTRLRALLARPATRLAAQLAGAFAAGVAVVALLAVVWQPQVAEQGTPVADTPDPSPAVAVTVAAVAEPPPVALTPATPEPEQVTTSVPADAGGAPLPTQVEAAEEAVDGYLMTATVEAALPQAPPRRAAAALRTGPAPAARAAPRVRREPAPEGALQWAMRATAPVVDLSAARDVLDEFTRHYAAGESRALRELFTSDGVANGRRGAAIARAYAERFERLGTGRSTLARVEFEPTPTGATVRTSFVLTHPGHPPIRGRATWELVREHDAVRVARVTSTPPEL